MSFDVDIGHASERGPRENNEDFAAVMLPAPSDDRRGLIAAVADGVASGGQGRLAAQTTVMSLVQDFHAVPLTVGILYLSTTSAMRRSSSAVVSPPHMRGTTE